MRSCKREKRHYVEKLPAKIHGKRGIYWTEQREIYFEAKRRS
jgi:hypothetical protein